MLETFLPGFNPENETQKNISFAMRLFGAGRTIDSLTDRVFKSRKEELEEKLLERQLELMGENPDTQTFNKSVMAARAAPHAPGFLEELFSRPKRRAPLSIRDVDASNVNFSMALGRGVERDMTKRAIVRGLKAL